MKLIIVWIKELFLLANAYFNLHSKVGSRIKWREGGGVGGRVGGGGWGGGAVRRRSLKQQHVEPASPTAWTKNVPVKNVRYSICLKIACPFHNSTNFQMRWFPLPQTKDSDTIWQGLYQNCRGWFLPFVAMLKLVRLRSRTHASWIISCLRQTFCVESDLARGLCKTIFVTPTNHNKTWFVCRGCPVRLLITDWTSLFLSSLTKYRIYDVTNTFIHIKQNR